MFTKTMSSYFFISCSKIQKLVVISNKSIVLNNITLSYHYAHGFEFQLKYERGGGEYCKLDDNAEHCR